MFYSFKYPKELDEHVVSGIEQFFIHWYGKADRFCINKEFNRVIVLCENEESAQADLLMLQMLTPEITVSKLDTTLEALTSGEEGWIEKQKEDLARLKSILLELREK
jgi:hypothetical protein